MEDRLKPLCAKIYVFILSHPDLPLPAEAPAVPDGILAPPSVAGPRSTTRGSADGGGRSTAPRSTAAPPTLVLASATATLRPADLHEDLQKHRNTLFGEIAPALSRSEQAYHNLLASRRADMWGEFRATYGAKSVVGAGGLERLGVGPDHEPLVRAGDDPDGEEEERKLKRAHVRALMQQAEQLQEMKVRQGAILPTEKIPRTTADEDRRSAEADRVSADEDRDSDRRSSDQLAADRVSALLREQREKTQLLLANKLNPVDNIAQRHILGSGWRGHNVSVTKIAIATQNDQFLARLDAIVDRLSEGRARSRAKARLRRVKLVAKGEEGKRDVVAQRSTKAKANENRWDHVSSVGMIAVIQSQSVREGGFVQFLAGRSHDCISVASAAARCLITFFDSVPAI